MKDTPSKTLRASRRPPLGFGLANRFLDVAWPHHVLVGAVVGELV